MSIKQDIKKAIAQVKGDPLIEVLKKNIEMVKKLTDLPKDDKDAVINGYQNSIDWITRT